VKTLIIAEAGVNHNGDIDLAKRLIDVAADSGADLVKFQTLNADQMVTLNAAKAEYQLLGTSPLETQHEMLSKLELSESAHRELIAHSTKRGIGFFSTGFDISSINLLVSLKQEIFKIPSGEITNLPYLRHIGQLGKDVIISTGMSNLDEIERALSILENSGTLRSRITVLHCTTAYPTPMADVNLRAMVSIQNKLKVSIGYSDHTLGIEIPIAAVTLGASVIEKHFTLDRHLPGPDHKASLEPQELKTMVQAIRNIEIALGDGIKRIMPSELANRGIARKSIVTSKLIKAGETFTSKNLTTKRPGTGVSAIEWDRFLGQIARRDYIVDEFVDEA
jgi:N,N'-diacetyllegionaminate synthase